MSPKELETTSETILEILKDNIFIDNSEEILSLIQNLIYKNEKINLKSLSLDDDSLYLEIIYINTSLFKPTDLINLIKENKNADGNEYKNYKFYIFFSKIEEQIVFEKKYGSDSEFTKNTKEQINTKSKIQTRTIFMPSADFSKPYIINIDSYLKRIDKNVESNEAFVCTAKLKDVIGLYNVFGDSLYKKNVRVKIKDSIGVDKAIQSNLEEDPENFWFYSNGFTMIVNKNSFSNEIENQLKFNLTSLSDISIVNGAQSVTVSSQHYYSLNSSDRDKLDKADVLLRIVFANNNDDFCNKITLALNRQKPIKQSDIKYFSPIVDIINTLSLSEQNVSYSFKILKNGEESSFIHSYSLEKFGKLFTCYYLQKPGTSRSAKGQIFEDDKIWQEFNLDENDLENDFLKKYKPLNYSMKLYDYAHKYLIKNADPDNPEECKLMKNGTDFFVAYHIWNLNNKIDKDFSKFAESFNEDSVINSIDNFIKTVLTKLDDTSEIESNYFKKDDNYLKLRSLLDKKTVKVVRKK